MNLTLKNLAILHSQKRITDAQVTKGLARIEKPTMHKENGETWYEGEQDNTIIALQAMIGDQITQKDFENFTELMKKND